MSIKSLNIFFKIHLFIGITTYPDMLTCNHGWITYFPVFTAKSISLQAFNNTSAFLSIVLIPSHIKFL